MPPKIIVGDVALVEGEKSGFAGVCRGTEFDEWFSTLAAGMQNSTALEYSGTQIPLPERKPKETETATSLLGPLL